MNEAPQKPDVLHADGLVEPEAGFVVVSPTPPVTLAAGASITATISFEPARDGPFTASLIVNTDRGSPSLATLSGTGLPSSSGPPAPPSGAISGGRPLEMVSVNTAEQQPAFQGQGDVSVSRGINNTGRWVIFDSLLPLTAAEGSPAALLAGQDIAAVGARAEHAVEAEGAYRKAPPSRRPVLEIEQVITIDEHTGQAVELVFVRKD